MLGQMPGSLAYAEDCAIGSQEMYLWQKMEKGQHCWIGRRARAIAARPAADAAQMSQSSKVIEDKRVTASMFSVLVTAQLA